MTTETQPTDELRPCCFCGSYFVRVRKFRWSFRMNCGNCDAYGPAVKIKKMTGDMKEETSEARRLWNERRER